MALAANLISYWKLDEASGTREDSVANNDLTDNNTVGSAAGIISNAADFEASSSESLSITDAAQSGLDITGNLSFSMWVKVESQPSGAAYTLLSKHNSADTGRSYLFQYQDSGGTKSLTFRVSSDGTSGNQTLASVNYELTTATLFHVVVTYATSGTTTFYVNGSSVGSAGSQATSIFNGVAAFVLGASAAGSDFFDGLIDEVGIWSKTLSTTEITALYNGGAGNAYPLTDIIVRETSGAPTESISTYFSLIEADVAGAPTETAHGRVGYTNTDKSAAPSYINDDKS
jgi:hypothetical protein